MVIGVVIRANVQVVYLTQADTEEIAACTHSNIGVAKGTLYTPRGGSVSCYILGCGRFAVLTKLLASLQRRRPKFLCGVVLLFAHGLPFAESAPDFSVQLPFRNCPLLLLLCHQLSLCNIPCVVRLLYFQSLRRLFHSEEE